MAKDAGLTWDRESKPPCWQTNNPEKAVKLIKYADPKTGVRITNELGVLKEAIKISRACESNYEPPCPEGKTYYPYQKAGIEALINKLG